MEQVNTYCAEVVDRVCEKFKLDLKKVMTYLDKNVSWFKMPDEINEKNKKNEKKILIPFPFNGIKNELNCNGLNFNYGLYTQCENTKESDTEYCKKCQKQSEKTENGKPKYGTIQDRLKVDKMNYIDPNGKKVVAYGNVMKKLKLDKEMVMEEAMRLNIIISEEEFEVQVGKRGRKKKIVEVVKAEGEETKKRRGRPKKSKEVISTHVGDDLIASLVAQAQKETSIDENTDENTYENSNESILETNDENKKDNINNNCDKIENTEEKKKRVVKKKSKKTNDIDNEINDSEKNKRVGKKNQKKVNDKDDKINESEEKNQILEKKEEIENEFLEKEEIQEEDNIDVYDMDTEIEEPDIEEPEIEVCKFKHNGILYLRSEDGVIYDIESQEPIGIWNEISKSIDSIDSIDNSQSDY